jgi:hypothetical protein
MSDKLLLTTTYEEPDEEGWILARVVEIPELSAGPYPRGRAENDLDALPLMLSPDNHDPTVAAGRSEQLDLILFG